MAHDRVMIVSHEYAPKQNPRALRWNSIARYWSAQGLDVDVITSHYPGLPDLQTSDGVSIYRVGKSVVERVRSRFSPGGESNVSGCQQSHLGQSTLTKLVRLVHDHTWKQLYWPDSAALWVTPASRMIQSLMSQNSYSCAISVSEPYSAHLATYRAMNQFTPMRWLVDISDPFSARDMAPPNNRHLYARRNHRLENEILRLASAITVTTEGTAAQYARLFPNVSGKLHVIGPLMTESEGLSRPQSGPSGSAGKKLVYVGTLYSDLRHPDSLLRAFAELIREPGMERAELHFYGGTVGTDDPFVGFQSLLGRNLFIHGTVARDRVLNAMREADLLVNIGNRSAVQLPSKVVEYVWSAKPIWNLSSVPNDCSAIYLKGYPYVLNQLVSNLRPTESQLRDLREFIASAPFTIPGDLLAVWRDRSRVSTIARQYADIACLNLGSLSDTAAGVPFATDHKLAPSIG